MLPSAAVFNMQVNKKTTGKTSFTLPILSKIATGQKW